MGIHPLVRDLYKRALTVGKDYPLGLEWVKTAWKKALKNPENCPSCYDGLLLPNLQAPGCEAELRKAVGRGRFMVREMIGVIQLKKYRTLKQRYTKNDHQNDYEHHQSPSK